MGVDLEIVSLLVSRVRRYDGLPSDGPEPYDIRDELVDSVRVRSHKGLVGDRYFGTRFAFAAMTMIAAEKIEQLDENLKAAQRLDFTDEELAEIDSYAVEAGINIWAASSDV